MRTFIVQAAPLIMHIRSKATRITNMKLPKKIELASTTNHTFAAVRSSKPYAMYTIYIHRFTIYKRLAKE